MKEKKFILATVVIAALPLAIIPVVQWHHKEFSRIPEKRMWIDGRDVKAGAVVLYPQRGVATILSSKFTIAFEGISWYDQTLVKGHYQVDGRYGGIFPPDSEPSKDEIGNGVIFEYSARKREALLVFKNHRFIYCDYNNTLKTDGKEYSMAKAPVHLWVSKKGEIKQLKSWIKVE